jgi:hypothetical protein
VKKCFKLLLALVIPGIMFAGSCKLDSPAPPPAPKADDVEITDQTVLGIVVNGPRVDNAYLTSLWKAKQTTLQLYDTSNTIIYGTYVNNLFTNVTLNDRNKSVSYTGLVNSFAQPTGTYKLSVTDNVLYIELSSNPFFNSTLSTVRVTHLTPTEMTWVALDTTSTVLDGRYYHKGYQVTFTK